MSCCAFYVSALLLLLTTLCHTVFALSATPHMQVVNDKSFATVTSDEIVAYAATQGTILSISTMGPLFRGVARASHDESIILGYCNGAFRPTGNILHGDSIQVFKPSLQKAAATNSNFRFGGGTVFGVGLLLGCLCLRHGLDNGCKVVEFLAIDDEDHQHARLVRHYKRLGLNVVRYVGEDIRDIPDRLVWGGCGTLMNGDIASILNKWTPTFTATPSNENVEKTI